MIRELHNFLVAVSQTREIREPEDFKEVSSNDIVVGFLSKVCRVFITQANELDKKISNLKARALSSSDLRNFLDISIEIGRETSRMFLLIEILNQEIRENFPFIPPNKSVTFRKGWKVVVLDDGETEPIPEESKKKKPTTSKGRVLHKHDIM